MNAQPSFLPWLALAGLADWLLGRTLARLAIFMPKSPTVLAAYQGLVTFGQVAGSLCAILALSGMGWLAWQARRQGRGLPSLALAGLALANLAFLLAPPGGWLPVGFQALYGTVVVWLLWETWRSQPSLPARLVALLPGLALLAGELYLACQSLYAALGRAGPAPAALWLFNLGEGLVLLSPLAFFRSSSRAPTGRAWAWALAPVLAFAAFYLLNPSLAGILAIWSAGLTLYLPWPAYALSLWLAGAGFLALRQERPPAAWAVPLLAAGGYAPLLGTQAFLGLIALWLLAQPAAPPAEIFTPSSARINLRWLFDG